MTGHGGFIRVYSQLGQGSKFTVYLPVANEASVPVLRAKSAGTFRGQGETILFVDDEPDVRLAAETVLQRLNFKVLTATDGADGLVLAMDHRSSLHAIITDLHMPQMDGLAFVRALRRTQPDIPVAVASSRMDLSMSEKFLTLGVKHRWDKPFTEAQLLVVLESLLTSN